MGDLVSRTLELHHSLEYTTNPIVLLRKKKGTLLAPDSRDCGREKGREAAASMMSKKKTRLWRIYFYFWRDASRFV
jgi:hypothetical protein